jgi:cell division protein FtsL
MRAHLAEDYNLLKNYDLPFLASESRLFRSNKLRKQISGFLNYERVIKYAKSGGWRKLQGNAAHSLSVQKKTLHTQTHHTGTRKCKQTTALNIHHLFYFLCYSTILFFSAVSLNLRIQNINGWH